jgi:5-methylcytosine-specific restriction endonuclease McrA
MLAYLYTGLELTCPDIGWLYERDSKTVHYWLRQAGVPTRPRGSHTAVHFKPGHPSRTGKPHRPETIEKIRAASIARGAIPYLRDGQHWLKGARPEDNPRWAGGATPERQEFYRSPEWKAACCAVWTRADACCERCGLDHRTVDRATESFHVHHIVSFAVKELRAAVDNLALLCRPCHLFVHSKANTGCEFLASVCLESS